jgi:hypothetical protein
VSGPAPETERERRLRELAGRLLAHPSPEGLTTAELFLGELPPDAPADLIVPRDLDLFGSLARRRDRHITGIEVIMDGTKPVSEFLLAYERDLESRGWRRWQPYRRHQPGGFEAGLHAGPEAVFVNEKAVSALWIATRQVEGARTEIGLRFDWENAANMMSDRSEPGPEPPGWDVLPELRPPPGVRIQPQGSSGGGGRWSSEARAQSEMPVPELEAHFAKQLTAAGWGRIAGAVDDTTGWSSWDVPRPGNWRGLLLVLATVPGWRSLSVRVETFPGQNTGTSWTSVVSTLR